MYRLARIISLVLSPLTLLPWILWWAIQKSALTGPRFWQVASVVFGIGVLVPVVSLVYFKLSGRVSDWGIPVRSQRHQMSLVVLLCGSVVWLFLKNINAGFVTQTMLMFLGGGTVFSLITWRWKISAHMAAVTLASLIMVRWLIEPWWLVLPLIAGVGWSRMYLKKHTCAQIIGGFGLALGIFFWAVLGGKV